MGLPAEAPNVSVFCEERRRVDALTHNKTFWSQICKKTQNFADLPTPKLAETLDIGQFRGRNGQIHIATIESYKAWLAAKTPEPKPPKIQLDLKQAQWIKDQLSVSPNQSELAKMMRLDRTSLIRTLNLTRLAPSIKEYIMRLEPNTRECPLTKKRLRFIATIAEPEVQEQQFKKLITSLMAECSDYTKIPQFH